MNSFKIILFAGILCLLSSCYYDEPPEPAPIDPDLVFFSTSIVPIFERACNSPGCHNEGENVPFLDPENAHNELVGGGYVNTTVPTSSTLYLRITGNSAGPLMPPQGRMSPTDIELILAWINKGALND